MTATPTAGGDRRGRPGTPESGPAPGSGRLDTGEPGTHEPGTHEPRTGEVRSTGPDRRRGRGSPRSPLAMRRRQGALAAALFVLLGLWVGFAPFLGPYVGYGYDASPVANAPLFTLDRLWLTTLPSVTLVLGGLILGPSRHRGAGALGALLALAGGVWLITGPAVSRLWDAAGPGAEIGDPIGSRWLQVLAQLGLFYGTGVVVCVLAAVTLARILARPRRPVR